MTSASETTSPAQATGGVERTPILCVKDNATTARRHQHHEGSPARATGAHLDCADACGAGCILSRQGDPDPSSQTAALQACLTCRVSAQECEGHARHHEHCRLCAEQCQRCEQACTELLTALTD